MTFLDDLRRMRTSKATALHRFRLQYPKHPDAIHIFVEGRDDISFYLAFVHRYAKQRAVKPYECGSRQYVIDTQKRISQETVYQGASTLFFIDKGYSDFLGELSETIGNLFCTDGYSIENYLVSERMLERVWVEFFHLRNMSLDFDPIGAHFGTQYERFCDHCKEIAAWIISVRLNGANPTLGNIRMEMLFKFDRHFDLDFVGWDVCKNHLEDACKVMTSPESNSKMTVVAKQLSHRDHKCWIRGKFAAWFFVQFVTALEGAIRGTLLPGAKLQIRTRLTLTNAIEVLSSKCDPPDSLTDFLVAHLN